MAKESNKFKLRQKFCKLGGRDSGNDSPFPDFASHTGRFRLILVHISSVISFQVDIRQLSFFLICRLCWCQVILICQIVLGYYPNKSEMNSK